MIIITPENLNFYIKLSFNILSEIKVDSSFRLCMHEVCPRKSIAILYYGKKKYLYPFKEMLGEGPKILST